MTNLRIEYKEKNSAWYAMKVTYQRIRKAEKILSEKNIENYSPLKTVVKFKNGKKSLEKQPIISNLIFIKANLNELNKIKREINFMFNMLTKNDDVLRPIIIPEKQMLQFISLTSNEDNDLIYLSAEDSVLKKGTRVKIMDGEFKNFEGRLTKIKGLREKRVVLDIDNVLSVAMCCIDAKFIEILR